MTDLLHHAQEYAARGWSIIPIKHRSPTGKEPAIPSWKQFQAARPGAQALREWFTGRSLDGLAVIAGAVSGGLVCRDFDRLDAYERWGENQPALARSLPTVATARGCHVYFRADVGRIIKLADGELRGRGYTLLPPSRHPTGHIYRWEVPLPDGPVPAVDSFRERFATEPLLCGSVASVPPVNDPDVEKAIRETLPDGEGQRNGAIFSFCRTLKAIPALADQPAAALRETVECWHRRALGVIGTKSFDATWSDFRHAWARVRFPKGDDPLALVLQQAMASNPPACAGRYESPEMKLLICVCRELQQLAGDRPFFVSCREAARVLGIPDHKAAWRLLRTLVTDGVLEVIERGTKTKATRYRYVATD